MKKTTYQRVLSLFLAFLLAFSLCLSAVAEEAPAAAEAPAVDSYQKFLEAYNLYMQYQLYSSNSETVLLDTLKKLLETEPKLLDALITSLAKSQDNFGSYFTAEEYEAFLNQKQYSGIGISVSSLNDVLTVTSVTTGTPAYAAGVKIGDIIYKVDGKKAYGQTFEALRDSIRGEENTPVKISFYRPSENSIYAVEMFRQPLVSSTINYEFKETDDGQKCAYVQIVDFMGLTTFFEFLNFKNAAVAAGIDKVIFDVRDNPGGDLNVVLELINWCIPDADKLICGIYAKDKQLIEEYKTTGKGKVFSDIAILVNQNSASAAELFAIALQENGVAKVIGTNTYGKAIGQTHFYLSDKSVVSLTTLEVASPSGAFYNRRGVLPDIEIANDEYVPGVLSFKPLSYKNYTQIKTGAKNDAVLALEQRLVHLGLMGEADNIYDEATYVAIQLFQYSTNLEITGVFDKNTLNMMTDVMNLVKYNKPVEDEQMAAAVDYLFNK